MATGFDPFSRRPVRWRTALLASLALLPLASPGPSAAAGVVADCQAARSAADRDALRRLQRQLQRPPSAPESLPSLLERAGQLLACGAPVAALAVLDRLVPAPGPDRQAWLLLRWQAAAAGLQHQVAAESLLRLVAGDPAALEQLTLSGQGAADRSALDQLADHLEALGMRRRAVAVLLSGRGTGAGAAARMARALELAQHLPLDQRQALLERALEQAAAAGAWGQVAWLLDQQLGELPAADSQALQRRLRLSGRIDDVYGEWRLRRALPAADPGTADLERQLRSPRLPGGHAAGYPVHP